MTDIDTINNPILPNAQSLTTNLTDGKILNKSITTAK